MASDISLCGACPKYCAHCLPCDFLKGRAKLISMLCFDTAQEIGKDDGDN